MPIKITGYDPDAHLKPEPERPARTGRSSASPSSREPAGPPPREVRRPVDPDTAEHLRIRYGIKNVKFSELAPKKATGAAAHYKSGSSYRGGGGARLSLEPEKPTVDDGQPAAPAASPPAEPGPDPEAADGD